MRLFCLPACRPACLLARLPACLLAWLPDCLAGFALFQPPTATHPTESDGYLTHAFPMLNWMHAWRSDDDPMTNLDDGVNDLDPLVPARHIDKDCATA